MNTRSVLLTGATGYIAGLLSALHERYQLRLTDDQGLFTTPLRANYSPLPHGVTDYQRLQAAAIAPANHSEVPHGFMDYQWLSTAQLRPN